MIKILNYTKNPLTLMGRCASICYDSKDSKEIAIDCIESGHTRVAEYADVTIEIDGYSARVIRELYTHITGVSRLQSSTRYVDYKDFKYYTPPSITENDEAGVIYDEFMNRVSETYDKLLQLGILKEDIANILPLGMNSKVVLKINVRAILHMAKTRMCKRALLEFRDFMREFIAVVGSLEDEWYEIMRYCQPKCIVQGFCDEKKSCNNSHKKYEDFLDDDEYIDKMNDALAEEYK